jgi:hypothetical protein
MSTFPSFAFHQKDTMKITSKGLLESWRNCTYWWSTCLMIFSIVVVMHGIAQQWNNPPWSQGGSYPALEIILFILMLTWIALLEGYVNNLCRYC